MICYVRRSGRPGIAHEGALWGFNHSTDCLWGFNSTDCLWGFNSTDCLWGVSSSPVTEHKVLCAAFVLMSCCRFPRLFRLSPNTVY